MPANHILMLSTHTIAMRKAMTLCLALFQINVRSLSQEVLCECVAPFKWPCWSPFPCGSLPRRRYQAVSTYDHLILTPHSLEPLKPPGKLTSEGHRTLYLGIKVLNVPGFRAPISGISHSLGVKNIFLWLAHKLHNTVLGGNVP